MSRAIAGKCKESIRRGKGVLAIILINTAVFVALNRFPALRNQLLLGHEIHAILGKPWTLFTVFFAHEIFVHLVLTMAILFFFGLELEKATNARTVIMVYILTGLTGSITFPLTRILIERTGLVAGLLQRYTAQSVPLGS